MSGDLIAGPAADVVGIAITLALTFVLGLEREESAAHEHGKALAGVRTIPIIGLLGHAMALLAGGNLMPVALGFGVVGAFLLVAYWHKIQSQRTGITSEYTALIAYMVGAMVATQRTGAAVTLTVGTVLLLTGKQPLRRFAASLPAYEISTFVTFLLLAGVILPVLPNQPFTTFAINPFQIWLVVVAVSGISYASYLLQRITRSEQSMLLTALLGGLYSSTATTVALARRSRTAGDPRAAAGGIIAATGTMYARILILVAPFSMSFAQRMAPALVGFTILGSAAGAAMILKRGRPTGGRTDDAEETPHPLEIRAALAFAALFLGLSVATQLSIRYLGNTGLLVLAGVVGVTDIVPFILGLASGIGTSVAPDVAVEAIMISIASNNVVKGLYALALGNRRTGVLSLVGLTALAVLTALVGSIL